jgi:DNA-binding NtrC family response regulator
VNCSDTRRTHLLEFERLGGTRTIRVNVRILAATNRDLSEAVVRKQFRSDFVLPPSCLSATPAALARAPRRYPTVGALFRSQICSPHEQANRGHSGRSDGSSGAMALARQHSRIGKFPGAFRDLDRWAKLARASRRMRRQRNGDRCNQQESNQWPSTRHTRGIGAAIYSAGAAAGGMGDFRISWCGGNAGHEAHHTAIENAETRNYERRIR